MVKTTVEVTGMACGMCEAHVNDAIRDAFSIKNFAFSEKHFWEFHTAAECVRGRYLPKPKRPFFW